MFKPYKNKLILSSLIILLPILLGLLLWNDLPATMTTHWGADGVADGVSGKAFAVFVLPITLLAGHWFCLWFTLRDPKNRDQSTKALGMLFWIMPCVSLFVHGVLYSTAMGHNLSAFNFLPVLLGLMFVFIGNYLPKCRQNHSLGIRLPWTFHTEENWNRTHRFGGMVWVAGGTAMIFAVLLPVNLGIVISMIAIFALCFIPMFYSYRLYRTQVKNGEIPAIAPGQLHRSKKGLLVGGIILAATAVLMFTGNIEVLLGDDALTIEASYWHGLTVEYAAIDHIDYRTDLPTGMRTSGFGSGRLQMGLYTNNELGNYTRYGYTAAKASIHITCGSDHLVIALRDAADTEALYNKLLSHIS